MSRKIGVLLTVAAIFAIGIPSVLACVTATPGFWKTHPDDWPVDSIEIGGVMYSKEDAINDILKTPPKKGNAWIILAQKVVAAKLSMLAPWTPPNHWSNPANFDGLDFEAFVAEADAWLASPGDRADAIAYSETIDFWLNYWDRD